MERFNGEVRGREKVIRGLKKKNTPSLNSYQVFHHFIRPHEALEGKTRAEACGIKGNVKWLTPIQNAKSSTERKDRKWLFKSPLLFLKRSSPFPK